MAPAMPALVISFTNTCFGATVVRSLVQHLGAVPGSTCAVPLDTKSGRPKSGRPARIQVSERGAAQLGEQKSNG